MPIACKEYQIKGVAEYNGQPRKKMKRGTVGADRQIYNCWLNMMHRCYNPNHHAYHNYGGRGIRVWKAWCYRPEGYIAFAKWCKENGYQNGLELDRKDNAKGYFPGNCRFSRPQDNQTNRRNNITIVYEGRKMTIKELWECVGDRNVSPATAFWRFQRGVPELVAVSVPAIPRRRVKELKMLPNALVNE